MLERVPATAESAAQFFLRNIDRPHRSARLLDPKFWRHGSQDIDTPAWWPIYLNKIRTVPHSRSCSVRGIPSSGSVVPKVDTPAWMSNGGRDASCNLREPSRNTARHYTQTNSRAQAYASQQVQTDYEEDVHDGGQQDVSYGSYQDTAALPSDNLHGQIVHSDPPTATSEHQGQMLPPLLPSGDFTDYTTDLAQYSGISTRPTQSIGDEYEPVEPPPTVDDLREIIKLPQPRTRVRQRSKSRDEVADEEHSVAKKAASGQVHSGQARPRPIVADDRKAVSDEACEQIWKSYVYSSTRADQAAQTFRLLSQSSNPKYKIRALTAFREVPEVHRTQKMCSWVVDLRPKDHFIALSLELEDNRFDNAIDIAAQAAHSKVNLFPRLTAHLVRKNCWNALGSLLRRCEQDKRISTLISSLHGYSSEQKKRLSKGIPPLAAGLLVECTDMQTLPESVNNLTSELRRATVIRKLNVSPLRSIRPHLKELCIQNPIMMKHVNMEDFLGMIDTERESKAFHTLALRTIINAPSTVTSAPAALQVYQSLRKRHPAYLIHSKIVEQLLVLCAQAAMPAKVLLALLDDFRTMQPKIKQNMYCSVMSACAKQGEAETVERLFKLYVGAHGKPKDLRIVSPLIYAYATSGDTENAQRQFDRIQHELQFVPNVVCWNMLLLAHARSENPATAFTIWNQMRDAMIAPDSHTYGTLLAVCAERGDTDSALDLLNDVVQAGQQITPVMSNTIVEAYLANDDIQKARQWVFETSNTMYQNDNKESRTRLWNSLLRYYAFRSDAHNFDIIEKSMQRRNIPLDEMSYAASLALLVNANRSEQALEKLGWIAKSKRVPVTQLHYSIVLFGLIKDKRRDMATTLWHELRQQFPKTSQSVGRVMLRQQADRVGTRTDDKSPDYDAAVELLLEMLAEHRGPQSCAIQAFLASLLQAMMSHGSSAQANVLLRAIEGQKSSFNSTSLLVQSLRVNIERKRWSAVDDLWQKLFTSIRRRNLPIKYDKECAEQTRSTNSSKSVISTFPATDTITETSTNISRINSSGIAPRVIAQRRFELEIPLNHYMEALARQYKQSALLRLLSGDFRASGFALTGRNWNKLIQVLCRSNDPSHHVKAFEFTEMYLINRAQSWKLLMRGNLRREILQPSSMHSQNDEKVKPKYKVVDRHEAIRIDHQRRIPTYLTMVHLASVLDRTQKPAAGLKDRYQMDRIIAVAPKTKRFLQQMPYSNDNLQRTILRGEPANEEMKPRPRSEESLLGKVSPVVGIGTQSVLDQLSPEHLAEASSLFQQAESRQSENTRLEYAEKWTGFVSFDPIVLAGHGRMESKSETESRLRSERKKKLKFFDTVMRELAIRSGRVHHEPFVNIDHSANELAIEEHSKAKSPSSNEDSPSQLITDLQSARDTLQQLTASKAQSARPSASVREQLDRLAGQKSLRNEQLLTRQSLGSTATRLAIPYAQLRRTRRNIAFKQRMAAAAELERVSGRLRAETHGRMFTRSKRFRQFFLARARLRALRASRAAAELRKQGLPVNFTPKIPFSDVGRGESRRYRFVTPQKWSKRSQMHLSHRTQTLISIRKRIRRGQSFSDPKIPYTGAAFRHNLYRHRMRLLQRYYERRLDTLPEDFDHRLRSEIYRKLQRVKLHLMRVGVARPDGSIDLEPWQLYLAAVKAGEYGDPTFWTAQRLAEIDEQETPISAPEIPQGPEAFNPLMYGKLEEEEREDLMSEAEKQARRKEIDELVEDQARYEIEHKEEYEQMRAEKAAKEAEKRGQGTYVPFGGQPEENGYDSEARRFRGGVHDDGYYVEQDEQVEQVEPVEPVEPTEPVERVGQQESGHQGYSPMHSNG